MLYQITYHGRVRDLSQEEAEEVLKKDGHNNPKNALKILLNKYGVKILTKYGIISVLEY